MPLARPRRKQPGIQPHGASIGVGWCRIAATAARSASRSLADRNLFAYNRGMRTLHLRNVPDDVMNRLERLARAASTSVTAVAIRELDAATRRVDNAALIATLPDLDVPADAIAEHIAADRR